MHAWARVIVRRGNVPAAVALQCVVVRRIAPGRTTGESDKRSTRHCSGLPRTSPDPSGESCAQSSCFWPQRSVAPASTPRCRARSTTRQPDDRRRTAGDGVGADGLQTLRRGCQRRRAAQRNADRGGVQRRVQRADRGAAGHAAHGCLRRAVLAGRDGGDRCRDVPAASGGGRRGIQHRRRGLRTLCQHQRQLQHSDRRSSCNTSAAASSCRSVRWASSTASDGKSAVRSCPRRISAR